MNPVSLHLNRLQHGANFVRIGIPLPMGVATDCNALEIVDTNGTSSSCDIACNITPTANWPDGSIKWCLAKIATLNANTSELSLNLTTATTPEIVKRALVTTTEDSEQVVVQSGSASFEFTKSGILPTIKYADTTVWPTNPSFAQLTLNDGSKPDLKITDVAVIEHDELSCRVQISGVYNVTEKQVLNAKFIFEVLPEAKLSLVCELHNPQRALHPGGIWDLGDPGSVTFKDFSLSIKHTAKTDSNHLLAEPGGEWISAMEPTVLFQASSGGQHWNNAVHKNANAEVPNQFCGYQVTTNNQKVLSGKRSSPTLAIESSNHTCTIQTADFWQNFPKSIDVSADEISLRLFPFHHGDAHELQGGERKRHHLSFNFSSSFDKNKTAGNGSAPYAKVAAEAYKSAGVYSNFDNQLECEKYEALLKPSRGQEHGFYAKREQLDEYGWRNFGEVFADHESAYHTEDRPYVSHYNNQYDSVFGFSRQYALSGDDFWQPLFTDLAKHIMDIDIYRTDEDRVEYNNGLFWHTDHYVEAHTATHRTYSAGQIDADGNPPAGGGPGPQHCYSTGLTYYYYMTGDEEAKKTVLGMGDWINNYYEGTGTLIEVAKKTLQEDTASFIKTCKGAKIFKYHYPMDRGTGNYIRTLLDCFDLSSDVKHLNKIEDIIMKTAGPDDEIDARGFDNIEYTWFYVIFLQEVVRYLDLKRTLNQFDDNFYHARATLLHYARWMVENEQPYLHNAERLDHPNATWAAQEPRKVAVFYAAYKYALKDRTPFLERARYFRDYLTEELSSADTLHYARIQVLLLQNHGAAALIDMDSLPHPGILEAEVSNHDECFYTPATHFKHIAGTWVSCLRKFRISNELRWIRTRAS